MTAPLKDEAQQAPEQRATTDALLASVSPFLDLVQAPFTLPRSRILVLAHPAAQPEPSAAQPEPSAAQPEPSAARASGGMTAPTTVLRVCLAEYERPLEECVVLERLSVADTDGNPLAVTLVLPDRIEFGSSDGTTRVTLTFAGPDGLSVGLCGEGLAEVSVTTPDGQAQTLGLGSGPTPSVRLVVGSDRPPVAATSATSSASASAADVRRSTRAVTIERSADHAAHQGATAAIWSDWFDRCPRVRGDLQAMTAFCWWVLGANIVELPGQGSARAVVPSKIGYVGLWQWDAYFIAVGLRHGDPDLAREQLDLAFRLAGADGQLPDVVHDEGVLASSEDLPLQDRETLRRHGSSVADPNVPVPLTKPPLAAWALGKVLETGGGNHADSADSPAWSQCAWAHTAWEAIARSQDWWFRHSDADGDGMPEYGHPYSSGLDDSPIFDGPLPLASPDLGAYLVVQDRELERHFRSRGDAARSRRHGTRADATLALLMRMWNAESGRFLAHAGSERIRSYTAVSLLPLLTGELPADVAGKLATALADPAQFGTPWTVSTVATGDPDFSPERMWRGPVWININALLVDGLRRSGYPTQARELAERTVALVINGGGPHEYFNPLIGQKARTATTAFGWSAALFIDLAVQLTGTR
jgi:hypothetical protein